MSQTDDSRTASFLKNHPRLLAALATLTLLATQAAPVLAEGGNSGYGGP